MGNKRMKRNGFHRVTALLLALFMLLTSVNVPVYAAEGATGIFGFSVEKDDESNTDTSDTDSSSADESSADESREEVTADESSDQYTPLEAESVDDEDIDGETDHSIKAQIVSSKSSTGKKKAKAKPSIVYSNDEITLTGKMPKNGIVEATPVTVGIDGEQVILAYDIKIYANAKQQEKGKTWQPADKKITVNIKSSALENTSNVNVYHMEDTASAPEKTAIANVTDGSVSFDASSFSIYAVTTSISTSISTPDGLTYKVTATFGPETGLPSDAQLSVSEVEEVSNAMEKAVDKVRPEGLHVAASRTFDISILDTDGKELQPADGTTVDVTFELEGIGNKNLSTNVYHLEEKLLLGYNAESLGVNVNGNTATVSTDGFSLYTVEFTYEGQQYVLDGESIVRLDEVLEAIGITGTVEAAEVSDDTKFEAHHSWDGNWYVYALQPFDTTEWMKVTVDGMVYEITVTDAFYGSSASGSAATTFANGMDIGTIVLQELGNYSGRTIVLNNKDLAMTDTWQIYWSGTIAKSGKQELSGAQVTIKYPGAAKTADGILCDVEVVISDVTIYGDTRTSLNARFAFATVDAWLSSGVYAPVAVTAQYMGDKNDIASYVTTDGSISAGQSRFGVGETITVNVYQAGTSTPVSGTFVMTAHDLNLNKTNTSWQYITEASSHHTFSEYVTVDGSRNDVYYNTSKLTRSGNDIYPSGNNGGAKSYETGLAILATSGISFQAYNGTDSLGTNFYVMPRGGINYTIESYSGNGGSIATTTTGAWESDGSVPSDATKLDGGTTSDPRTYVVPSGKAVTYKMTPETGYGLSALYVDGTQIAEADANGNPKAVAGYTGSFPVTQDSNGSIYYTFPAVGDTHKINVEWEPSSDPELKLGHVAMIPGTGGGVTHKNLQTLVNTQYPDHEKTSIPKNGTAYKLASLSLQPPTTIAEGTTTYSYFTFALGYADAEDEDGIPDTFYAKSDDLTLRYTASGEYQYCVNYTGTNSDTWETWSVKDSEGNTTVPTIYAVYTKDDTDTDHTVYATATAIARNTTDAGFVNPDMPISFEEHVYRVNYTINVKKPTDVNWNASSTEYLEITAGTPVEISTSDQDHTHTPGQAHGHALQYTTDSKTIATNQTGDITFNVYADYMTVKETAPIDYTLSEIVKKHGDQRGTATVAADGKSGTFKIYSVAKNATDSFTVDRTGDTGYVFTVKPVNAATNTEVEFINTRDTVKLKLKELLEDASMGTADTDTHPFAVTLRAREQWTDASGKTSEHYSMLGTYTITPKNMDSSGASETVDVPANADILIIQRYGDTSETNSSVKVTNYDTEVTSDKKDANNNDIVQPYRPLAKEYIIAPIREETTVTLKNTLMPRTVTVKKTMVGGDTSSTFNFTAKLEKGGNALKDYVVYYDAGGDEVKTDNKGEVSFTLSGNGSIDLKMPYGTKLTVTEEDGDDFKEAYSIENADAVTSNVAELNGDGSGITAKNTELVFTNTSEFSVYDDERVVTYEFYLDESCTKPYKYTLAAYGDVQETTNKQILRNGSVLVLPEQPTSSNAAEVFQGWYIKNDDDTSDDVQETDFGKKVSFTSTTEENTFTANAGDTVKLYAKFSEVRYVVFHEHKTSIDETTNDGSGNTTTQKVTYWPVMRTDAVEKNNLGKYVIDLTSIQPVIVDSARTFLGWAITPTNAENEKNLQTGSYDFTAANGSIHLYPAYTEKLRVSFWTGDAGSGATYIPAKLVERDTFVSAALTGVSNPTQDGYSFAGWYYDAEYNNPVTDDDQQITADITLYAKWNPANANYTVVIWTQKASDEVDLSADQKSYEFHSSYAYNNNSSYVEALKLPAVTTGSSVSSITLPSAYMNAASPLMTADDVKAFSYSGKRIDSDTALKADGSTTINLYFDRKVVALRFFYERSYNYNGRTYVQVCDNDEGFQSNTTNVWTALTKKNGQVGNGYDDYGKYGAAANKGANTSWRDIGSVHVDVPLSLYQTSGVNKPGMGLYSAEYATNTTVFNQYGNQSTTGSITMYYRFIQMRVLYGHELTEDWPTAGVFDQAKTSDYNATSGTDIGNTRNVTYYPVFWGTRYKNGQKGANVNMLTLADDAVIDSTNASGEYEGNFILFWRNQTFKVPLKPYFSPLAGETGENPKTNPKLSTVSGQTVSDSKYVLQEDLIEDIFSAQKNYPNTNPDTFPGVTLVGYNKPTDSSRVYYAYYKRHANNVTFYNTDKDASTFTTYTPKISGQIPYGEALSKVVPDDPTPKDGYHFAGWYADSNLTVRVFFENNEAYKKYTGTKELITTMPDSNLAFYAKWEKKWYLVQVDPAGGELGGTSESGATWFWVRKGDTVSPYDDMISRNYDQHDDGEYYYHNYQYSTYNGTYDYDSDGRVTIGETTYNLNGYVDPPHKANYDKNSNEPNDGKKYRELPGAWKLLRWDWEKLNSSGEVTASGRDYLFTNPVDSNLKLTAVWEKVEPFRVVYEIPAGTGELVADATGSTSPMKDLYGNSDSASVYLEGTGVTISKSVKPTDPMKQFLGWRVKGGSTNVYALGETYTVSSQDALPVDSEMVITLVAQYGDMNVTSLMYDANGGEGSLTDLVAATGSTQVVDAENSTLHNIELNDTVTLSKGAGFTKDGYYIVGWCRHAIAEQSGGADPTVFTENTDGTTTTTSDGYFGLGQDVIVDGATGNRLYAVWKQGGLTVKAYTYEKGDWENGVQIYGGIYKQSSTDSGNGWSATGLASQLSTTENRYMVPTGYAFAFGKVNGATVTNVKYANKDSTPVWQYSTDDGSTWTEVGEKSLNLYYYKTTTDVPVYYVRWDDTHNTFHVMENSELIGSDGNRWLFDSNDANTALTQGSTVSVGNTNYNVRRVASNLVVPGGSDNRQLYESDGGTGYKELELYGYGVGPVNATTLTSGSNSPKEHLAVRTSESSTVWEVSDSEISAPVTVGADNVLNNMAIYVVYGAPRAKTLTVTKQVTGGFADYNQEFDFTISGLSIGAKVKWQKYNSTDGTNYTEITGPLSGGSGTANAGTDGEITFKLKHNQKIELAIPKDAKIIVSEATGSFYTTTMKTSDDSTASSGSPKEITMSDDKSLAVVNNMTEVAPTGINMKFLPFLLIGLAGVGIVLISRRRRLW